MTEEKQRIRDEEHLRLLGIFYYVSGGLTAFFGLFPLIYVFMGVLLAASPEAGSSEDPVLRSMGLVFASFGLVFFLVAQGFAALKFFAAYSLLKKRRRVVCLVIGGISLLGIPYSTILGVFTLLVLLRDSVRELFEDEHKTVS